MAKGDGSITEVKRGVWRVCVSGGRDPLTGKRIKSQRIVHGTKAKARSVRDELRAALKSGSAPDSSTTFGEFSAEWARKRRTSGDYARNTVKRDLYNLRVLNEYLSNVALAAIKPITVDMLMSRIREERGLSGTTMNNVYKTLSQVLRQAVDYDLIPRNPCERTRAPKRSDNDRRSLSSDEAARLMGCIEQVEREAYAAEDAKEARQTERNLFERGYIVGITDISCALAARFGLVTGARRGEVLGLRRRSVDLASGSAEIAQSVAPDMKVTKPKNGKIRRVSLDKGTAAALRRWLAFQESELAKIGVRTGPDTPVFCDAKGGYLNPNNFSRWWRSFTERNGFSGLRFHELRHTQATQLLANGVDVKTVQARLGHAKASITLDMYAHALPENDQAAADLVGELFAARPSEPREDTMEVSDRKERMMA